MNLNYALFTTLKRFLSNFCYTIKEVLSLCMENKIRRPEMMFKDNKLSRKAFVTYLWFIGGYDVDENTPTFFNRKLFKEQSEFKSDTTVYKAIAELVKVGLFRITSKPSYYTVVSFDKPKVYVEEGPDISEWYTDNYHEYQATLDPNKDNEERLQGFLEGLAWSIR